VGWQRRFPTRFASRQSPPNLAMLARNAVNSLPEGVDPTPTRTTGRHSSRSESQDCAGAFDVQSRSKECERNGRYAVTSSVGKPSRVDDNAVDQSVTDLPV